MRHVLIYTYSMPLSGTEPIKIGVSIISRQKVIRTMTVKRPTDGSTIDADHLNGRGKCVLCNFFLLDLPPFKVGWKMLKVLRNSLFLGFNCIFVCLFAFLLFLRQGRKLVSLVVLFYSQPPEMRFKSGHQRRSGQAIVLFYSAEQRIVSFIHFEKR